MIIQNIKEEFYEIIKDSNILILANSDVDSVCTVKILLSMFNSDNIKYTICCVENRNDLIENLTEQKLIYKNIILVNCGGNFNLSGRFSESDSNIIFVIDNHLPYDLENFYSLSKIRLFVNENYCLEDIPEFSQVFREHEGDLNSSQEWEEVRNEILQNYYKNCYYGASSAVTTLDISRKLGKDSIEFSWFAICGLTEMFILKKITRRYYISESAYLQQQVLRLTSSVNNNDPSIRFKIHSENALQLYLYSHWTLMESLCCSPNTSSHFQIWTVNGKKRLHNFLADMGMPLAQCNQSFITMDSDIRNAAKESIASFSPKFGLNDLSFPSFNVQFGYQLKITAADYVLALIAIMDYSILNNHQACHCFFAALDSLSMSNVNDFESHVKSATSMLSLLAKTISTFIDLHYIISAGPFLFGAITQTSENNIVLCQPSILLFLANFALLAHAYMTKSKKAKEMPFVLTVPKPEDETSIIIGVPPLLSESFKNPLSLYFEKAIKSSKIKVLSTGFIPTMFTLKTSDRTPFFDALVNSFS